MGKGIYRKQLEAMEYVDNGMDLRENVLNDILENDKELKSLADRALYIEEEWRNIITDYVYRHYPTQVVVSAETNSLKGLGERNRMKTDFILRNLQEESKEEYNKASEEYTKAYLKKKEEWLDKAIPCAIGRTINKLKENGAAIEAVRDYNYQELYRLAWYEIKHVIGINLWLAEEIKRNKDDIVRKISDAVNKYAFDTWK